MTYKEFVSWCNERACDGCWSMGTAIYCIKIMNNINRLPFWKRQKEWLKVREIVEKEVVSVINAKIQALKRDFIEEVVKLNNYMRSEVK